MPKLQFILVQHAARETAPAGDCITLGFILYDSEDSSTSFCDCRFAPHWESLVKAKDSKADLKLIAAVLRDIELSLKDPVLRDGMLKMIIDSWSNTFRVSDPKTYVCEDYESAMKSIAKEYF